ncbi:MAG: hypothetical protein ACREGA_00280 [Candidatus Saccharimonadales bacterium]
MKQKDIVTIIIAVAVSAVISIFVAKFLFNTPKNRQQKVEVVPSISENFPTPDTKYFNQKSINPTQLIKIGNNNNLTPFAQPKTKG